MLAELLTSWLLWQTTAYDVEILRPESDDWKEKIRLEALRRIAACPQASRIRDPVGCFKRDLVLVTKPEVLRSQAELAARAHKAHVDAMRSRPEALRHITCVYKSSSASSMNLSETVINHKGEPKYETVSQRQERLEKYTELGQIRPCTDPSDKMLEAYYRSRLRGLMLQDEDDG
mmetsp:Transcript_9263/g.26594  ORF Transcript_9263/g.26594 Transcript_9263/m.26594 type:complete len:175 (+) Transcript_9263:203-727(+)